jgi:hypothetical protein
MVAKFWRVGAVFSLMASAICSSAQFDITNGAPSQTAGTLFVDLRADTFAESTWTNFGTLGNFTPVGTPIVATNVGGTGVPGVLLNGASAFEGPLSPLGIDGGSDRSIEVWAFNPSIAVEESLVSWGHRGVTRRNMTFNYGSDVNWGAAAHHGDDLGWNGTPLANAWHHLVYTYSNGIASVYADGALKNVKTLGGPADTFAGEPINIGCQRDSAFGNRSVFFSGFLNMVRVHDGVLTPQQVMQNYQLGSMQLIPSNSPPPPPNTNYPAGTTITFNDVNGAPWLVNSYGKIPEFYQPSELLGSGIITRFINVGGYSGGPDTTGAGFSAYNWNGGLSPSIVMFNQHVHVRSLWVDTYGGRGIHVYVRGYTYSNDPVPAITVDVPTLSHPNSTGYRWVQVTNLDNVPIQKLTVETSVPGDNSQFDDITIRVATNNIPPPNFLRDKLTIMPLGDSITWGMGGSGGYRAKLWKNLKRAGYDFYFVGSDTSNPGDMPFDQQSHQGHPGYTIYEDNLNLDNNVPPTGAAQNDWNSGGYWITRLNRPPDIILIHLGTNDIGRGQDGNGQTAAENMDAMLTHIYALAPEAHVILAKIIPINTGLNANAVAFNNLLPGIVATHQLAGQKVMLVDQYANFVDESGNIKGFLLPDAVHPNDRGYDLMADTWFHAIRLLSPAIVASNPPPAVVGVVPVRNFSFETNAMGDGGTSLPPEWIVSAPISGIYNPEADAFVTATDATGGQLPLPAQGRQLAYMLNPPGQIGTLQQLLPDVYLTENTTYTLAAAIGRPLAGYRYSSDNFSGYKVELLAGETVIAAQTNAFAPIAGTFQDAAASLVVNANTVPTNYFGRALMIRLHSLRNLTGSNASTFFDNVRLTVTPVLPKLDIARDGANVVVRWPVTGYTLQHANAVTGNWANVTAASPHTNTANATAKFYRLAR